MALQRPGMPGRSSAVSLQLRVLLGHSSGGPLQPPLVPLQLRRDPLQSPAGAGRLPAMPLRLSVLAGHSPVRPLQLPGALRNAGAIRRDRGGDPATRPRTLATAGLRRQP